MSNYDSMSHDGTGTVSAKMMSYSVLFRLRADEFRGHPGHATTSKLFLQAVTGPTHSSPGKVYRSHRLKAEMPLMQPDVCAVLRAARVIGGDATADLGLKRAPTQGWWSLTGTQLESLRHLFELPELMAPDSPLKLGSCPLTLHSVRTDRDARNATLTFYLLSASNGSDSVHRINSSRVSFVKEANTRYLVHECCLHALTRPISSIGLQVISPGVTNLPGSLVDVTLKTISPGPECEKASSTRNRLEVIRDVRPAPLLRLRREDDRLVCMLEFGYARDLPPIPAARAESLSEMHHNGTEYRVYRDRYRESLAEGALLKTGVTRSAPGTYVCDESVLPGFVGEHLPSLKAQDWTLVGEEVIPALNLRVVEAIPRIQILKNMDWFSFSLNFRAGSVQVSLAQVLDAWRAGQEYVKHRSGTHLRLPVSWLKEVAGFLDTLGELPRINTDELRLEPVDFPLAEAVLLKTSRSDVHPDFVSLSRKLARIDSVGAIPLPPGLGVGLRPYQVNGYQWLQVLRELGLGGVLADDMGLGKTLQVLALLLAERNEGRQSLVVAPTSVLENWAREAKRFAPELTTVVLHGSGRWNSSGILQADLLITSYALLRRDLSQHMLRSYHYVVLDEAQAIKNPASESARVCRSLSARHRLALTGTPIENRLLDLWSLFAFVQPGLLRSQERFQLRYINPITKEGNTERQVELRARIAPFMLRRLKQDVARDLPSLTESILYCDLDEAQAALYHATLKVGRTELYRKVEVSGIRKHYFAALELLLKLRQICCHPLLARLSPRQTAPGSAKLDLFLETLEEILVGQHRVLVFSQFVQMLSILRTELDARSIPYLYLDGSTRRRQALIDRFNHGVDAVFLISLKAGGSGLNLTGADYVIHYDPWWNPAVEAQATNRAHRIGQTRPVLAYRLITRGTVEERMLELHEQKRSLVEGILQGGGASSRNLTLEDLQFLFSSSED